MQDESTASDQVSVTIPAGYVDDFAEALESEIGHEADQIGDHARDLKPSNMGDVRTVVELMGHDVRLYDQLAATDAGGDVTLVATGREEAEALAHAFDALARNVVGPRLADQLEIVPIDREQADVVLPLVAELRWAVERAAEVFAEALAMLDAEVLAR